MSAVCRYCGEDYPRKRLDLGYLSCLDCGQKHAEAEKAYKAKCTAPAYNKGAYMYIGSADAVKGIFKCGEVK
jgi:ribosomal protein L37AE/L43A